MAEREFWIDAAAVRRARRLLLLFLVNWGLLGWVAVVAGRENRLLGGVALALGLVVFLAALAQLRTTRYAARLPLVVVDDDGLGYRLPAEGALERVGWSALTARVPGSGRADMVKLRGEGGEILLVVGALSEDDRRALETELARRLPEAE